MSIRAYTGQVDTVLAPYMSHLVRHIYEFHTGQVCRGGVRKMRDTDNNSLLIDMLRAMANGEQIVQFAYSSPTR